MKVVHGKTDITEYILSFTWGGSTSEAVRKLEIAVVNAPNDPNIKPVSINLADRLYLYDDDGAELFRGYVIDRERSNQTGSVTYTAYDMLYYMLKSTATYNFKRKTAEFITNEICKDMEIPIGALAQTGIDIRLSVSGVSIYEIIMRAYTQAYYQNRKKYKVTTSEDMLNVIEMGKVVCKLELSEETNIDSSNYKESLQSMVNRVRIYDSEGNQVGLVEDSSLIKKYGIFQSTYTKEDKDATTKAKSLFNGVEKSVTLDCLGFTEAVTGAGIHIRDTSTGIVGLFWIDADTHKWENGIHTMSLTLTFKQLMDTKEG